MIPASHQLEQSIDILRSIARAGRLPRIVAELGGSKGELLVSSLLRGSAIAEMGVQQGTPIEGGSDAFLGGCLASPLGAKKVVSLFCGYGQCLLLKFRVQGFLQLCDLFDEGSDFVGGGGILSAECFRRDGERKPSERDGARGE